METAEWIIRSEIFSGCTVDDAAHLAVLARPRRIGAGVTIHKLGAPATDLYVVREGRVTLTFPLVILGVPKEVRFRALDAGRTFAWSALVTPHRMTMSAHADSDVTVEAFSRDDLLRLFGEHPSLGLIAMTNLARIVSERLVQTQALWARELQRNVSVNYWAQPRVEARP